MKKIKFIILFFLFIFNSCSTDSGNTSSTPINNTPISNPPIETINNQTETTINQYDGYQLIWNDEFNTSQLDISKWNYEIGTGINGDFGTGQLDRATDRTNNVKLIPGTGPDGSLVITTNKENYIDRQYTSGRINTKDKFSVTPGTRIEARIWAKDVKYKGQGFAFWMMPAEKPTGQDYIMWPQGGEIDIMEYVGAIPYANLGSVHYAWSYQNNQFLSWNHGHKGGYYSYEQAQVPAINPEYAGWPTTNNNPNAGSGAYHLYRIDWYNNRIEFSVDNNVYHINYFNDGDLNLTTPDGEDADATVFVNGKRVLKSEYSHHFNEWKPFDHNFYIILSAGIGGSDTNSYGGAIVPQAVFPCSVLIDYVRVYNRL